jgi:hypothetical protein
MSSFKDALQNLILQQASTLKQPQANRIGYVTQVNPDGTIGVLIDGRGVTAACNYQVVQGQQVIVFPVGNGFNAAPTQPTPTPTIFEPPPYFTGGNPLRSVINLFGPQIVNPNLPAPANPQFIFLQDAGNSAVFQFIVGGLSAQTYLGKVAISPNGRCLAAAAFDTAAGFVRATNTSPTTFPKQVDWTSWSLPKNFNFYINQANVIDKTVPLYSIAGLSQIQNGILALSIIGTPIVTNADVFIDMAVDNAGNVYLLIQNTNITLSGSDTALTYSIYKNGNLLSTISVTPNTYFNATLWKVVPLLVLSLNSTSGFVDLLAFSGATPSSATQDPAGLTFSRTDSTLSYWAPSAGVGINPFFLSIDTQQNIISWQFTNYHTLTGGSLGGYVILTVIFDGVKNSGYVILTTDPGIIPNVKFAGKIYPIGNVKKVDATHYTAQLVTPITGVSPGKTKPDIFNFGFVAGGTSSFVGAGGTVLVDRSFT